MDAAGADVVDAASLAEIDGAGDRAGSTGSMTRLP